MSIVTHQFSLKQAACIIVGVFVAFCVYYANARDSRRAELQHEAENASAQQQIADVDAKRALITDEQRERELAKLRVIAAAANQLAAEEAKRQ